MVLASPMNSKKIDFSTFELDKSEETENDFDKVTCCGKVKLLSS